MASETELRAVAESTPRKKLTVEDRKHAARALVKRFHDLGATRADAIRKAADLMKLSVSTIRGYLRESVS